MTNRYDERDDRYGWAERDDRRESRRDRGWAIGSDEGRRQLREALDDPDFGQMGADRDYLDEDDPSYREDYGRYGYGATYGDSGRLGESARRREHSEPRVEFGEPRRLVANRAARGARDLDFAGRGPRGFRRSDERIREEVCERLTDDDYLDPSDVEVRVESGVVTLVGTIDSRQAKRRAEEIAERVRGVTDVSNEIRVGHGAYDGVRGFERA